MYNINNPEMICNNCNFKGKVFYMYLKAHMDHDIYINSNNLNVLDKSNFENYFINENCFEKTYANPESFEKNFYNYFFHNNEIYRDKSFKLYNDEKRNEIISDFCIPDQFIGDLTAYFGQTGMGKSIILIGVSKYLINHLACGTLYLNCKCLSKLLEKHFYTEFRNIIIDEIPFLFFDCYDDYCKCSDIIYKYNITNDNDLWKLFEKIIKFIQTTLAYQKGKKFIFYLDQYNSKIDKNDNLFRIFETYIVNKKEKFGIITVSSMNNTDIKDYKINLLENTFNKEIVSGKYKYLYELNEIIDKKNFKFKDDYIDEQFNLLGRTIKNYNILNYYSNDIDNINEYITKKKIKIDNNIKNYYNYYKENNNIIKLLYFSTETKYSLKNFIDISKYVPFKYFIPQIKEDNKKNKYVIIKYSFPLIEEVINDLLQEIIYNFLNIYQTLINNKLIDGGARGQLFEKLVTYYLTPNKKEKNISFFKDFTITDVEIMPKFISRSIVNEGDQKFKKKIHLNDGTYLFKQSILNGKDLDLLIIKIENNVANKIYCLQISIYKNNSQIFSIDYLKLCFLNLKNNLINKYDFKIKENEFYFTYIFDFSYKKKNETKFNNMIKNCDDKNMKYILFNPNNIEFLDIDNKKIYFLIDNSINPYLYEKKEIMKTYDFKCKDLIKPISSKTNYVISNNEINSIIEILQEDYGNGESIKGINFIKSELLENIEKLEKNKIYIQKNISNELFFIYFSIKKNNFTIKSFSDLDSNSIFSFYDSYEILK